MSTEASITPVRDRAYYTTIDVLLYSTVITLLVALVGMGIMLALDKTTVPSWLYMLGALTVGVALTENIRRMKASNESTRRIDENLERIENHYG